MKGVGPDKMREAAGEGETAGIKQRRGAAPAPGQGRELAVTGAVRHVGGEFIEARNNPGLSTVSSPGGGGDGRKNGASKMIGPPYRRGGRGSEEGPKIGGTGANEGGIVRVEGVKAN